MNYTYFLEGECYIVIFIENFTIFSEMVRNVPLLISQSTIIYVQFSIDWHAFRNVWRNRVCRKSVFPNKKKKTNFISLKQLWPIQNPKMPKKNDRLSNKKKNKKILNYRWNNIDRLLSNTPLIIWKSFDSSCHVIFRFFSSLKRRVPNC